MKTGRVKIFAYNSKGEEVSEVYRFRLQDYMDYNEVHQILNKITKYSITLYHGLGRKASKHEIYTFEQLCSKIASKVFKEKVIRKVEENKAIRTELFTFTAPEEFRISEVAHTFYEERQYTFFTLDKCWHTFLKSIFHMNGLSLGVARNNRLFLSGSYFSSGHYSIIRDKENKILWKVSRIDYKKISTTEVEAIITL